ncbi:MAG TPA: hypothetical protein VJX66_11760 [Amycolatopsis sp.]|nr:hypothetical protein [Amycolatopsis sp.]
MTVRLIFGRLLPGMAGETRRVVHIFEVPGGNVPPERLTALCGMSFGKGELEPLDGPRGIPCESCLCRNPGRGAIRTTARPEALGRPRQPAAGRLTAHQAPGRAAGVWWA